MTRRTRLGCALVCTHMHSPHAELRTYDDLVRIAGASSLSRFVRFPCCNLKG